MNENDTAIKVEKAKEQELNILKYVDKFCRKNNINYFLAYGTLLGSIRHNGFIPWDDDIDICMTNEDYKKFVKLYKNEENKPYFFQTYITEKNTPFTFSKIRKDGTKFISSAHLNLDIHQGIFIDIFPLYKVPKDNKIRTKHIKRMKFWRQLYISKSISRIDRDIKTKKDLAFLIIRKILYCILYFIPKKFIYKKLNKVLEKYEYLANEEAYFYGVEELKLDTIITYKDIFPLVQGIFENESFFIPHNWDKILKHSYGDYMKLPPVNERRTHRPVILELGIDEFKE